jgi:hypothetical protein
MRTHDALAFIFAACVIGTGCGQRAALVSPRGTAGASPGDAGTGGAAGASGGASATGAAGAGAPAAGASGASGDPGTVAPDGGGATEDPGPVDASPVAAGPVDAGPGDAGPGDAGPSTTSDAGSSVHGWVNRTPDVLPSSWPSGRRQPAVVYDRISKHVVVYGGYSSAQPVQDTWEWDGAAGLWKRMPVDPPAMFDMSAAVWDDLDGWVLLFGGETFPSAAPSSQLWSYAQGWYKVPPNAFDAAWPPAQLNPLFAYDAARARVVLLGSGASPLTWEWDALGGVWLNRTTVTAPTNNQGAFAWDETRHRGVFFGAEAWGETWEWDGVAGTWTKIEFPTDHAPSPRTLAAAAYDSDAGRVVLFGGSPIDSPGAHSWTNDLWEWDGAVWTLLDDGPVPDAPFPREAHGMTYDSGRHCFVVFGGDTPDDEPRDLWEWHR